MTVNEGLQRQELGCDRGAQSGRVHLCAPAYGEAPLYGDYPFFDQLQDNINKQVGVSLQVPIFNGLQVRSSVQRAKPGSSKTPR